MGVVLDRELEAVKRAFGNNIEICFAYSTARQIISIRKTIMEYEPDSW